MADISEKTESISTQLHFIDSEVLKLNEKIGLNGDESIEKYKQLVYKYFLRSEDLENKCIMLHRNVEDAWEKAQNLKDSALKERELMTLKYAKGEKQMLDEKELKEKAEKKCKALENEIKILNKKLQLQTDERNRISVMYSNKMHELKTISSENEGIINQNTMLKNELKLCQIAVKNQAELYNKAQHTIKDLKEGINTIAEDKHTLEVNEKKMMDLMIEVEKLESDKNEKMRLLKELNEAFSELEDKYNDVLKENSILNEKMKTLESNMIEYQSLLEHGAFNINSSDEKSEKNLNKGSNIFERLKQKLDLIETKTIELENDIKSCRSREKDTLLFSQQLAEKNAMLQSENENINKYLNDLNMQKKDLENQLYNCEQKNLNVSKQANNQKELSQHSLLELETLKEHVSEQSIQNLKLKQQLFDQQEEILIMKRKHSRVLKELQKKMSPCRDSHDDSDCPSSMSLVSNTSKTTELSHDHVEVIQTENASHQKDLLVRLLQLQEINVRKSERIDFLEDKIKLLLLNQEGERLLQFYSFNEQKDDRTSSKTDVVKRVLRRLRDIVASHLGHVSEHNLTLKLSLEINRKLQTIVEDVLLKNIILKESMSILGEEIDKLKRKLDFIDREKHSKDSCQSNELSLTMK